MQPMPFALQRLVFFALLLGMVAYTVVTAVLLQTFGKGLAESPIAGLDDVAVFAGLAMATGAMLVRRSLQRRAELLPAAERSHARFRATLVPLAILEGGCLLGTTTWLLNGRPVPGLVVGMVLLSLAVLIVPMRDPDADRAD
jgi:hypothetical protein